MKTIVDLIKEPTCCEMALQVLTEFAKEFYPMLENYVAGLAAILTPIILNTGSKNEGCCILAMEFWETVAVEYK